MSCKTRLATLFERAINIAMACLHMCHLIRLLQG